MEDHTIQICLLIIQTLTFIAIVFYVWKTWAMADATRKAAEASEKTLSEMRIARELENRPYVMVYFQTGLDGTTVELIIKNIGRMQAEDVRFEFDRELDQGDWNNRTPIGKSPKFTEGIRLLPPNLELKEFFAGFVNLRVLSTSSYRVKVRYRSPLTGTQYEEEQTLEWKSLEGKLGAGNEWYQLGMRIEKLMSEMKSLLESISKK